MLGFWRENSGPIMTARGTTIGTSQLEETAIKNRNRWSSMFLPVLFKSRDVFAPLAWVHVAMELLKDAVS